MTSLRPGTALDSHGAEVLIRPLAAGDRAQLDVLAAGASEHSLYRRFFNANRASATRYLESLLDPCGHLRRVLVLEPCSGSAGTGMLIGLASFDQLDAERAELAILVAEGWQHCGVGTLLLEALISAARADGLTCFVANVLLENQPMQVVLHDLGLRATSAIEQGVSTISVDLKPTPEYLEGCRRRLSAARAAALRKTDRQDG
jgi:RimJ/RimL family protein N-acetyltransferase